MHWLRQWIQTRRNPSKMAVCRLIANQTPLLWAAFGCGRPGGPEPSDGPGIRWAAARPTPEGWGMGGASHPWGAVCGAESRSAPALYSFLQHTDTENPPDNFPKIQKERSP